MKTTYLVYKQIDGVQRLVPATRAEWDAIIVRRINHDQRKEPCMYCHVRDGYDYRIIHGKKRMGDDRY